jgi:hypothetical protein
VLTRPSLQDLSNRGRDSKFLALQQKAAPTRPSLQDRASGGCACYPGHFEARGSCVCTRDGSGGSPSSNAGFGCTKPCGNPAGFLGSRGPWQASPSAKASFAHSGRAFRCRSVGFSREDWGRTGGRSVHNGFDASWLSHLKSHKEPQPPPQQSKIWNQKK